MCESHIHIVMPFSMEGRDNCAAVRLGGEQSCAAAAGRNEGELHRMSLERKRADEPSPLPLDEGRRGATMANPPEKRKGQNGSCCSNASAGSAQAACREVVFEEAGRSPNSGTGPSSCRKWPSHKGMGEFGEVGVVHSRAEMLVVSMDRRGGTWLAAHERGKQR